MEKNITVGTTVHFRLDRNWEGEGRVIDILPSEKAVVVKLLRSCKEHAEGTEIIVDVEEIVV